MEVLDDRVLVDQGGQQVKIPCQSVIFAAGSRADQSLFDGLIEAGIDAVEIGDAIRPGKIIDAIQQGYHTIRVLE